MEPEFSTEDIRNVFSKIMQFIDSSESEREGNDESPPPRPAKLSEKVIHKPVKIAGKPVNQKKNNEKPGKKVTAGMFEATTYARLQARQQALEEKLKRNAKLADEKIQQNVKAKPNINKTSVKLQHVPISERYEDILAEKKRKISLMTEKIQSEREKEIVKELTFQPNVNKATGKVEFGDILERMNHWEEMRAFKVNMVKEEMEEKLKEVLTFKPAISRNSVKLIPEMGNKDVVLRLLDYKKAEIKPDFYPFSPKLSEKTVKLARTRSQTFVFSRLFQGSRDNLAEEKAASSDQD